MKIELLNPEEVQNLFKNWGNAASVCYDTTTSSPERIGRACMNSGHTSGSRGDYIKFKITEVPRFTVDQAVRHSVGTFMNVGSFRYIDKNCFAYEIPAEIVDNSELLNKYIAFMDDAKNLYTEIQDYVYAKTNSHERANESARYVLPMSTHTAFVMGFTVEALIHFMHKRLCTRAEDVIRHMALLMKEETIKVLPELKDKLVPECQYNLWCPESKGCGAYPSKKFAKQWINEYHTNIDNIESK